VDILLRVETITVQNHAMCWRLRRDPHMLSLVRNVLFLAKRLGFLLFIFLLFINFSILSYFLSIGASHDRWRLVLEYQDRLAWCSHACPLPCHVGNCPPCKALVKRTCHCGSMKHVFECLYYNTLTDEEQLRVRSCGGPCHR
jgi:hypothetical protein